MAFTTLVDYSRQLRQYPDTTAVLSGDTKILGTLELGSIHTDGDLVGYPYYSKFYMSSSTVSTTPHMWYTPVLNQWNIEMPDNYGTSTEYVTNTMNIKLSSLGNGGEFIVASQQSAFLWSPTAWGTIQSRTEHQAASFMVYGSGTTSATTAFTVTSVNADNSVPTVSLAVDDGGNVRIGERSLTGTGKVYLQGGVLTNEELFDTLMIGSDGQVGTTASLRNLKQNIDYKYDSSWVYDLKPAKFEFKKYPDNTRYGFIAEDVEEVNPHFAKYNNDGSLRGVKDELLSSVILKELIELRKKVDPSFRKTYEEDKVKVVSSDYEIIYDGTIIARGGGNIKLTISDSLSGVVRIKSLANVTVSSNRLIDEKWGQMVLENGSSISLLCHNEFVYILSSDGDKLK
tara:strand:+ start:5575 stop:6771 length:1197 start_codon:yes stop_codon:yes gene_type:complete